MSVTSEGINPTTNEGRLRTSTCPLPVVDHSARRRDLDQAHLVFERRGAVAFALHELHLHELRDQRNDGNALGSR